jgi:hypothetical protein
MMTTGAVKMNEEYKREVRVFECPSCGNKAGVYYGGKRKEEK